MPRRLGCGAVAVVLALAGWGCGGAPAQHRAVTFVGFDAGEPLVKALRAGKLKGLVVQDPYKMGELAVRTLVDHLEGKPVERQISTGETLATPENMDDPEIRALLDPPKLRGTEGNPAGAKAKEWRIMVIPKGTTHEFWQTIHAGARKAEEELGNVEVVWKGPLKESERAFQIDLVRSAVATGVDGIALAPLDERALVAPVEEAIDRGIPVVIFDSGLRSEKVVSYVATDNHHGGVLAARRLGELLGGRGRIILLRYAAGSASTEQREAGFTDTLRADFPGITYLSEDQYAGATADEAQRVSQNLITKFRGRVDGIFCVNESSTYGMLRALEGAGMLAGGGR